jgi:hypothetical protein
MQVKIYKNFLSKEECEILTKVAKDGLGKWLGKGVTTGNVLVDKRYTSRMYMGRYEYPQIVRDISDRIRKFVGIDLFPLILGHGKDGVVVSYTVKNGDVYPHKDPRSVD